LGDFLFARSEPMHVACAAMNSGLDAARVGIVVTQARVAELAPRMSCPGSWHLPFPKRRQLQGIQPDSAGPVWRCPWPGKGHRRARLPEQVVDAWKVRVRVVDNENTMLLSDVTAPSVIAVASQRRLGVLSLVAVREYVCREHCLASPRNPQGAC
jgi:hypothetical protein